MKPSIKITLNGKEYRLRMTIRALINIEEELGVPISQIPSNVSIKQACIFIKAALRGDNDKPISAAEWDEILDNVDVADLMGAMQTLVSEIGGEGGESEKN